MGISKSELLKKLAKYNDKKYETNSKVQLRRLKILKELKRPKEALEIAEKPFFLDNSFIQRERILILVEIGRIKKALEVCEQECFLKDKYIGFERIVILCSHGRYEEALNVSTTTEFLKDKYIQAKRVFILEALNKNEEALQLAESPLFQDDIVIQIERLSILLKLGRQKEVLALSSNFTDPRIRVQYIKALVADNRHMEALAETEKDMYAENTYIQSFRISILVYLERYEEALEVANADIFKDNRVIYINRIKILIRLNRYEEALSLCKNSKYEKDYLINVQHLNILVKLGRDEEALALCNSPYFVNNEVFIKNKRVIALRLEYMNKVKEILSMIINGLDYYYIEASILDSSFSKIEKIILITALMEKYNMPVDFYLKKEIILNRDEEETINVIKELLFRIQKKPSFDINYYQACALKYHSQANYDMQLLRLKL